MEIKKVAKIHVYHISIDEEDEQCVQLIETIELKEDTIDSIVERAMEFTDLIIEEEDLRKHVQTSMETPGVEALQITLGKAIPCGNADVIEWGKYGAPNEISELLIEWETKIEVIVGGQKFALPAVRVV